VLIVGRTESNLKSTSSEINATGYYVLDTGDIASVPSFVSTVISEHPDVDCLINNAGVQRPLQVFGPDYDFDLAKADQEIDINIRGPMHLALGFMDHFAKKDKAVIMNVSSVLGFVPFSVVNPVYNGTKAWVHFFTTNLRTQLAQSDKGKHIKVVEIAPPQVETDLHRDRKDPDDNKKHKSSTALSLEEFMKEVIEGWEDGSDTITAGPGNKIVKSWDESMGATYKKMIG
jgi:short-subunit dehydrogenase involved in D-alanine esterification of teichoic acids